MTCVLEDGVEVKTSGAVDSAKKDVFFGRHIVSMSDFCAAVHYVLTNTDLLPENDPRQKLVEAIKGYQIVPGYGGSGSTRYHFPGADSLYYPG